MTSIRLRPYQPADWPRLCAIHDSARLDELRAAGLADAFLTLEQTAQDEGLFDGALVVAVARAQVVGFVAHADGSLNWLYVDPACYRQGVGRRLLQQAIVDNGNRSMSAEVLVGNTAALALYLSEGFTVARRVDGKLTGNEAFAASGFVLERAAGGASGT